MTPSVGEKILVKLSSSLAVSTSASAFLSVVYAMREAAGSSRAKAAGSVRKRRRPIGPPGTGSGRPGGGTADSRLTLSYEYTHAFTAGRGELAACEPPRPSRVW